ncbi:MAG: 3-hydroxyacyl-CoA dehydrogenase NAD-binding domain-containing protein [Actinomycetota bacterium]|jgi:3-hydroxybutyryl-CoA dehydrogenase|nr:3-hydroxyacyl-CoA dehydrogenase NAD-binding domain-containing protein [Actinomycetota bacterium]
MQISVLGAGTMGAGIVYVAAAAGMDVRVYDVDGDAVDAGLQRLQRDLDGAVARHRMTADEAGAARARVLASTDLEETVGISDLVVEAVVEDVVVKRDLLTRAEALAGPDTVLATNTSSLSVTEIMAALDDPGRGIGMHFFNPVRAMRLCELVLGLETRAETVGRAEDAAKMMGKQTVRVRDVAGFATSRINAVIGNEAFFMLAEGVASADDIDTAVKLGLNHPMGPLEMADLVGLDVRLAVLNELRRSLGDKYRPAPLLDSYVKAGRLGRKVGRGVYDYDDDGNRSG